MEIVGNQENSIELKKKVLKEMKINVEFSQDEILADVQNSDFVIIQARFLLYEDFDEIRDPLVTLAKKGCKKALAMYLKYEDFHAWDKDLEKVAQRLDNSSEEKTPEEWEIVANYHLKDPISIFGHEEVQSVKDLRRLISMQMSVFEDEFFKCRSKKCDCDFEKLEGLENQILSLVGRFNEFGEKNKNAIFNAKTGYYARFFKTFQVNDLSSFIELSKDVDEFIDVTDSAQIFSFGLPFPISSVFSNTKYNFNRKKSKDRDLFDYFAYAQTNYYDFKPKIEKKGVKMLERIAYMPFIDPDLEFKDVTEVPTEEKTEPPQSFDFEENAIYFG